MPCEKANGCTHPRKSAEGTPSVVPSKRALRRPEASAPRRKTTGSVSTIERVDLSAMRSLRARAQSFRPGVGEERDGSKKTSTLLGSAQSRPALVEVVGPGRSLGEVGQAQPRLNVRSVSRSPMSTAQASWRPGERVVGGERAALGRQPAGDPPVPDADRRTEVSAPSRFVSDAP
jgi:hypothetical protein